jgi:hypothetical protein
MEFEDDIDIIMDIEDALEEYLKDNFYTPDPNYPAKPIFDEIPDIVRKYVRMPVEEWPLYINDKDPMVSSAVTWLLKNAVRRD